MMAKKRFPPPSNGQAKGTKERKKGLKIEWKIENVVATAVLDLGGKANKINLNQVARKYTNCEYNPERFPGLVMRIDEPKATILLFSTAKMVITGMRLSSEAETVVNRVVGLLEKVRIHVEPEPEITIQNIVASGDLNVPIDLNEAAIIMENAIYEPEVFPGLIYRMKEPKTVFLMFSTGRIVCTGAKTKEIVEHAIEKLAKQVRDYGIAIKDPGDIAGEFDFF
ncbi:MAG: TATA-box-binding protein [Candidatus Hodarchaeota archaeon]